MHCRPGKCRRLSSKWNSRYRGMVRVRPEAAGISNLRRSTYGESAVNAACEGSWARPTQFWLRASVLSRPSQRTARWPTAIANPTYRAPKLPDKYTEAQTIDRAEKEAVDAREKVPRFPLTGVAMAKCYGDAMPRHHATHAASCSLHELRKSLMRFSRELGPRGTSVVVLSGDEAVVAGTRA